MGVSEAVELAVGVAVPLAVGDGVRDGVGDGDGVKVGVWLAVGVAVARRTIMVASSVGETMTVGVCGASICRLHPASAAVTRMTPRRENRWVFMPLLYGISAGRRETGV